MADNFLERHYEEYEARKAAFLRKKRHLPKNNARLTNDKARVSKNNARLTNNKARLPERPEDEAL